MNTGTDCNEFVCSRLRSGTGVTVERANGSLLCVQILLCAVTLFISLPTYNIAYCRMCAQTPVVFNIKTQMRSRLLNH